MKYLKSITKILVLTIFIVSIKLPVALADVLIPGEAPVSYCFQVANMNKYPNYLFIAYVQSQNPGLPKYNIILKQGQCLGLNGYREYSNIYAIKKSQVKSQETFRSLFGESLKDFNRKKPLLIPAQTSINSVRRLPERYGLKEVADVLNIVGITPKSLDWKYQEVIYTFQSGKSEKKVYQTQDTRPLPSDRTKLNVFNLIIPGISIFGMMLLYRKSKLFGIQK